MAADVYWKLHITILSIISFLSSGVLNDGQYSINTRTWRSFNPLLHSKTTINYTRPAGDSFKNIHRRLLSVSDVDNIHDRLWAAIGVRENVINILGTILHQPVNTMEPETYYALNEIYHHIRLRRVDFSGLLSRLGEAVNKDLQQQFKTLFIALRDAIPESLESTVHVIIEALISGELDMSFYNYFLDAPLGRDSVDILYDVDQALLSNKLDKIPPSSELLPHLNSKANRIAQKTRKEIGNHFRDVMRSLFSSKFPLTQSLFAAFVSFRPLQEIDPEYEETELTLVNLLRQDKIPYWDDITQNISQDDYRSLNFLIQKVFMHIASNSHVPQKIREDVGTLTPYLSRPVIQRLSLPVNIRSIYSVFNPEVDMKRIIYTITEPYDPEYIINLRDKLVYYIKTKTIDLDKMLKNFPRYKYSHSTTVFRALLIRIIKKQPTLNKDIISAANSLQLYLQFKTLKQHMIYGLPRQFIFVPSLLKEFIGPPIPLRIQVIAKDVKNALLEEQIDWNDVVWGMSLDQCVKPVQCFLNTAKNAIDIGIKMKKRTISLLKNLIAMFDSEGNPTPEAYGPEEYGSDDNPYRVFCKSKSDYGLAPSNPFPRYVKIIKILYKHDIKSIQYIHGMDSVLKLERKKIIEYHKLTENYQLKNNFPREFVSRGFKSKNKIVSGKSYISFYMPYENGYTRNINPIKSYESEFESSDFHGPHNDELLSIKTGKSTAEKEVYNCQFNLDENKVTFLSPSNGMYHNPYTGVTQIVLNNTTFCRPDENFVLTFPYVKPSNRIPNHENLLTMLPETQLGSPEDQTLAPIKIFLMRPDIFSLFGKDFNPTEYPTSDALLREMLNEMRSFEIVENNTLFGTILKYFIDVLGPELPRLTKEEEFEPSDSHNHVETMPHLRNASETGQYLKPVIEVIEKTKGEDWTQEKFPTRIQMVRKILKDIASLEEVSQNHMLLKKVIDWYYKHEKPTYVFPYPIPTNEQQMQLADTQKLIDLLPPVSHGTPEENAIRGIINLFQNQTLIYNYILQIKIKEPKTKGTLLRSILSSLRQNKTIMDQHSLFTTIDEYYNLLGPDPNNNYEYPFDYPIPDPEEEMYPPNVNDPESWMPKTNNNTPANEIAQKILQILSDPNLYMKLGDFFDPLAYQTRRDILSVVLKQAIEISVFNITKKQKEIITNFLKINDAQYPKIKDLIGNKTCDWLTITACMKTYSEETEEYYVMLPLTKYLSKLKEDNSWLTREVKLEKYITLEKIIKLLRFSNINDNHVKRIIYKLYEQIETTPLRDEEYPLMDPTKENEPANIKRWSDLLPQTIPKSPQEKAIAPIRYLLNNPSIFMKEKPEFKPEEINTKQKLLLILLENFLEINSIKNNPTVAQKIQQFIYIITPTFSPLLCNISEQKLENPWTPWDIISVPGKLEPEHTAMKPILRVLRGPNRCKLFKEEDIKYKNFTRKTLLIRTLINHLFTAECQKNPPLMYHIYAYIHFIINNPCIQNRLEEEKEKATSQTQITTTNVTQKYSSINLFSTPKSENTSPFLPTGHMETIETPYTFVTEIPTSLQIQFPSKMSLTSGTSPKFTTAVLQNTPFAFNKEPPFIPQSSPAYTTRLEFDNLSTKLETLSPKIMSSFPLALSKGVTESALVLPQFTVESMETQPTSEKTEHLKISEDEANTEVIQPHALIENGFLTTEMENEGRFFTPNKTTRDTQTTLIHTTHTAKMSPAITSQTAEITTMSKTSFTKTTLAYKSPTSQARDILSITGTTSTEMSHTLPSIRLTETIQPSPNDLTKSDTMTIETGNKESHFSPNRTTKDTHTTFEHTTQTETNLSVASRNTETTPMSQKLFTETTLTHKSPTPRMRVVSATETGTSTEKRYALPSTQLTESIQSSSDFSKVTFTTHTYNTHTEETHLTKSTPMKSSPSLPINSLVIVAQDQDPTKSATTSEGKVTTKTHTSTYKTHTEGTHLTKSTPMKSSPSLPINSLVIVAQDQDPTKSAKTSEGVLMSFPYFTSSLEVEYSSPAHTTQTIGPPMSKTTHTDTKTSTQTITSITNLPTTFTQNISSKILSSTLATDMLEKTSPIDFKNITILMQSMLDMKTNITRSTTLPNADHPETTSTKATQSLFSTRTIFTTARSQTSKFSPTRLTKSSPTIFTQALTSLEIESSSFTKTRLDSNIDYSSIIPSPHSAKTSPTSETNLVLSTDETEKKPPARHTTQGLATQSKTSSTKAMLSSLLPSSTSAIESSLSSKKFPTNTTEELSTLEMLEKINKEKNKKNTINKEITKSLAPIERVRPLFETRMKKRPSANITTTENLEKISAFTKQKTRTHEMNSTEKIPTYTTQNAIILSEIKSADLKYLSVSTITPIFKQTSVSTPSSATKFHNHTSAIQLNKSSESVNAVTPPLLTKPLLDTHHMTGTNAVLTTSETTMEPRFITLHPIKYIHENLTTKKDTNSTKHSSFLPQLSTENPLYSLNISTSTTEIRSTPSGISEETIKANNDKATTNTEVPQPPELTQVVSTNTGMGMVSPSPTGTTRTTETPTTEIRSTPSKVSEETSKENKDKDTTNTEVSQPPELTQVVSTNTGMGMVSPSPTSTTRTTKTPTTEIRSTSSKFSKETSKGNKIKDTTNTRVSQSPVLTEIVSTTTGMGMVSPSPSGTTRTTKTPTTEIRSTPSETSEETSKGNNDNDTTNTEVSQPPVSTEVVSTTTRMEAVSSSPTGTRRTTKTPTTEIRSTPSEESEEINEENKDKGSTNTEVSQPPVSTEVVSTTTGMGAVSSSPTGTTTTTKTPTTEIRSMSSKTSEGMSKGNNDKVTEVLQLVELREDVYNTTGMATVSTSTMGTKRTTKTPRTETTQSEISEKTSKGNYDKVTTNTEMTQPLDSTEFVSTTSGMGMVSSSPTGTTRIIKITKTSYSPEIRHSSTTNLPEKKITEMLKSPMSTNTLLFMKSSPTFSRFTETILIPLAFSTEKTLTNALHMGETFTTDIGSKRPESKDQHASPPTLSNTTETTFIPSEFATEETAMQKPPAPQTDKTFQYETRTMSTEIWDKTSITHLTETNKYSLGTTEVTHMTLTQSNRSAEKHPTKFGSMKSTRMSSLITTLFTNAPTSSITLPTEEQTFFVETKLPTSKATELTTSMVLAPKHSATISLSGIHTSPTNTSTNLSTSLSTTISTVTKKLVCSIPDGIIPQNFNQELAFVKQRFSENDVVDILEEEYPKNNKNFVCECFSRLMKSLKISHPMLLGIVRLTNEIFPLTPIQEVFLLPVNMTYPFFDLLPKHLNDDFGVVDDLNLLFKDQKIMKALHGKIFPAHYVNRKEFIKDILGVLVNLPAMVIESKIQVKLNEFNNYLNSDTECPTFDFLCKNLPLFDVKDFPMLSEGDLLKPSNINLTNLFDALNQDKVTKAVVYLKMFLRRPNIMYLLGPDLKAEDHPTMVEFLLEIFRRIEDNVQDCDDNFYDVVFKFERYLRSLIKTMIKTHSADNAWMLVLALPPPKNDNEKQLLSVIYDYLRHTDNIHTWYTYVPPGTHSFGEAMEMILTGLTEYVVKDTKLQNAVQYYQHKARKTGLGKFMIRFKVDILRITSVPYLFQAINMNGMNDQEENALQTVFKHVATHAMKGITISKEDMRGDVLKRILINWRYDNSVPGNVRVALDSILPKIIETGIGEDPASGNDGSRFVEINDGTRKKIVIARPSDRIVTAKWTRLLLLLSPYKMSPVDSHAYQTVLDFYESNQAQMVVQEMEKEVPTDLDLLRYAVKQKIKDWKLKRNIRAALKQIKKYIPLNKTGETSEGQEVHSSVMNTHQIVKGEKHVYISSPSSDLRYINWPEMFYIVATEQLTVYSRKIFNSILKYVFEEKYQFIVDVNQFITKSEILRYALGYMSKDSDVPGRLRSEASMFLDTLVEKYIASEKLSENNRTYVLSKKDGYYNIRLTSDPPLISPRINKAYVFSTIDTSGMDEEAAENFQNVLRYAISRDLREIPVMKEDSRGVFLNRVLDMWFADTSIDQSLRESFKIVSSYVRDWSVMRRNNDSAFGDDGSKFFPIHDGVGERIVIAKNVSEIANANWPYLLSLLSPYKMLPSDAVAYQTVVDFFASHEADIIVQALFSRVPTRCEFLRYAISQKIKDSSLNRTVLHALAQIERYIPLDAETSGPADGPPPHLIKGKKHIYLAKVGSDLQSVNWIQLMYIIDTRSTNSSGSDAYQTILYFLTEEKYEIFLDRSILVTKSEMLEYALRYMAYDLEVPKHVRLAAIVLEDTKIEKVLAGLSVYNDHLLYELEVARVGNRKPKYRITTSPGRTQRVNIAYLFLCIDNFSMDKDTKTSFQIVLQFLLSQQHTILKQIPLTSTETRKEVIRKVINIWKKAESTSDIVKKALDNVLPYINDTHAGSSPAVTDDGSRFAFIHDGSERRIVILRPMDKIITANWPYLLSMLSPYTMLPEDCVAYQYVVDYWATHQDQMVVQALLSTVSSRSAFLHYAILHKQNDSLVETKVVDALKKMKHYIPQETIRYEEPTGPKLPMLQSGRHHYIVYQDANYQYVNWPQLFYFLDVDRMISSKNNFHEEVMSYVFEKKYHLLLNFAAFSTKSQALQYVLGYMTYNPEIPEKVRKAAKALREHKIETSIGSEPLVPDNRQYVVVPYNVNSYKIHLATGLHLKPKDIKMASLFRTIKQEEMDTKAHDALQTVLHYASSHVPTRISVSANDTRSTVMQRVFKSWMHANSENKFLVSKIKLVENYISKEGFGGELVHANDSSKFMVINDGRERRLVIVNSVDEIVNADWSYLLALLSPYQMDPPGSVAFQTILNFISEKPEMMTVQVLKETVPNRALFLRYAITQKMDYKKLPKKVRGAFKEIQRYIPVDDNSTGPPTGPGMKFAKVDKQVCLMHPNSDLRFEDWMDVLNTCSAELTTLKNQDAYYTLLMFFRENKYRFIVDHAAFNSSAGMLKYVLGYMSKDPSLSQDIRKASDSLKHYILKKNS